MSLETEVQKLTQASSEQTTASQKLAQEVAGKVGEINKKVAEAQKQFNDFVGGDFSKNVNDALQLRIYIDPDNGSDDNDGSSEQKAIKSSLKLYMIVNRSVYYRLLISVKSGGILPLEHNIRCSNLIYINSYGIGDKPLIYQGKSFNSTFGAETVELNGVDVKTYQAAENESITANIYSNRALFSGVKKLVAKSNSIDICDNQLFHVHNGGSGDSFGLRTISLYNSIMTCNESAAGSSGNLKTVFTFFGGAENYPIDFMVKTFTVNLSNVHASLKSLLGCTGNLLRTNTNLEAQ